MSRLVLIVVLVAAVLAALFFLSTMAKESPTHRIEVAVPQGANAR